MITDHNRRFIATNYIAPCFVQEGTQAYRCTRKKQRLCLQEKYNGIYRCNFHMWSLMNNFIIIVIQLYYWISLRVRKEIATFVYKQMYIDVLVTAFI